MSKERRSIATFVWTLMAVGVFASTAVFTGSPLAKANVLPTPCDWITGSGYVITDNGYNGNFTLAGGCKNGGFNGSVSFVDNDPSGEFAGLHVSSVTVEAYFEPAPGSNVRDLCGTAATNLFGTVKFRARTEDNGDPTGGGAGVDKFGLKLTGVSPPFTGETGVIVTTRLLAAGDIELHAPNRSTTGPGTPPDEIAACGSDDSGLGL